MATRAMVRPKTKGTKSSSASRSPVSSEGRSQGSVSSSQQSAKARQSILAAPVRTVTESVLLMKKMLASSVSTICYARGVFPADCFTEKKLPDNSIAKLLTNTRDGKPNPKAMLLIEMLQGTFDALEKKYLREFKFGISFDEENPDIVEESYNFLFEYDQNGSPSVSLSPGGAGEHNLKKVSYNTVKKSICQLMRQILFLTSSMERFAANREAHLSVKLLYYDDRTPPDYEPIGFAPTNVHEFIFNEPVHMETTIGAIGTSYHEMGVEIRSIMAPCEEADLEQDE